MRVRTLLPALLVLATATLGHSEEAPAPLELGPSPVEVKDVDGVYRNLYRDGRVYVAGQPSAEALVRFKEFGVTAVVNLRTDAEMDDRDRVPFNEAARLEELGIEYVHLPIGGDEQPFRPEVLARLDDVLRRHPGPVLLHCTVAWRASWVWTGYLIRYQGLSVDDALARGEAIALEPSPLEGLLGRPVHLELGEPTRETD